jgi:hypothetical protein
MSPDRRLSGVRLLEAAHIIGDIEEAGEPVVSNGLALCSIHHRAYDHDPRGRVAGLRRARLAGCSRTTTARCSIC